MELQAVQVDVIGIWSTSVTVTVTGSAGAVLQCIVTVSIDDDCSVTMVTCSKLCQMQAPASRRKLFRLQLGMITKRTVSAYVCVPLLIRTVSHWHSAASCATVFNVD